MEDMYSEPIDETPPSSESLDGAPSETVIFGEPTLAHFFSRPGRMVSLFWQVLTRERASIEPRREPFFKSDEPLSSDGSGAADVQVLHDPVIVEPLQGSKMATASPVGWIVALGFAFVFAGIGGTVLHNAALDPAMHAPGKSDVIVSALAVVSMFVAALGAVRWTLRRGTANKRGQPAESPWWVVIILLGHFVGQFAIAGFWGSVLSVGLAGAVGLALMVGNAAAEEIQPDAIRIEPPVAQDRVARGFWPWFQVSVYQLMLVPLALLASVIAIMTNVESDPLGGVVDVVLTPIGFIAWVLSIILWILIFAVDVRQLPGRLLRRVHLSRIHFSWTALALLAIIGLGAFFRLYNLNSTPPEMTSDHIEKLLDSLHVSEGHYGIFFPNNGGREGFQMYVVAFIAKTLGIGFNFTALKLATVIEGLITLPVLWWMARHIFGDETEQRRALGNWVGLALAGLVAVSSWHVMLSRLGLRIVLTPLTTALVIGFLARAIRYNRMRDYVALGFTLGSGLYLYQANRMLPIIVGIGITLVLLARIRLTRDVLQLAREVIGFAVLALTPILAYWYLGELLRLSDYNNAQEAGERLGSLLPLVIMSWFSILALNVRARHTDGVLQYGGGLLAIIVIALALYIPMYRYSELYPEYFWNRTWGRIFGESAFDRLDPVTGALVSYQPGLSEQIERFWEQRDVFNQNYQTVLKMFHWEGDGAWINNAHSHPALDGITGGLLLLGTLMWGARILRRPSAVDWLVPLAGLVMLLPSAMTLAHVNENPSFTRASGSIPAVFLLAALPLGAFCWRVSQLQLWMRRVPAHLVLAPLVLGGMLLITIPPNWENFFTDYRLSYSQSWKPYREISKPLREFAQGEGSYGNAFVVAYPHWLDHRILGTMAGDIHWSNGLVQREDLLPMMQSNEGTPYAYDPTKPLFVMYNIADVDTDQFLRATFPGGSSKVYTYTYDTDNIKLEDSFYIYRAPLGIIVE